MFDDDVVIVPKHTKLSARVASLSIFSFISVIVMLIFRSLQQNIVNKKNTKCALN